MSGDQWNSLKGVLGEGPDASRRLRQRARALDGLQRRPAVRRFLPLAVGLAAMAVAALVWLRPAPLVRELDGTAVAAGALLVAEQTRPLTFSEGSEVVLASGTRARLAAVDSSQVDVVLESGRLDAHVTKGTGRTWRYHAGDWVVRVVGTRLSVSWQPSDGALEVAVTEGAVEVSGPSGEAVLVRAGERLQRRRGSALRGQPQDPSGPAATGTAAATGAAGDGPGGNPTAPGAGVEPLAPSGAVAGATHAEEAPQFEALDLGSGLTVPVRRPVARPAHRDSIPVGDDGPHSAPPAGWKLLLLDGKRREALAEATREGVLGRADLLSDVDALALADAARLERRFDVSRQLLSMVLARNGADAAEAAFLLGRIEVDARQPGAAATFFRRATQLAPQGPFAEQAQGRLMECLVELEDHEAAQKVATDYLRAHPAGAWAGLANRIVAGAQGR